MRRVLRSTTAALAFSLAVPLAAAAAVTEGTWTATERTDERLQLTLHWNSSTWGQSIARAELRGLSDQEIAAATSTPVSFRIEREAGTFDLEGVFRDGKGAGHFRFQPNRQFGSTLRSLEIEGADQLTDRQLINLALAGVSTVMIREFNTLGFSRLTVRNLSELSIHNVTPEYVRTMREVGVEGIDRVSDVVAMRIHGVTPDYVRELAALGFRELSRRQLVEMRIHGVTPEAIRDYQALGYRNLSQRQLVTMRIHRVTPEFIRQMREAGFEDLAPEALVRIRIHGIDRAFIRADSR